ncbi:hypothetical protein QEN19_002448 [Hanseniaspora menglaensis]
MFKFLSNTKDLRQNKKQNIIKREDQDLISDFNSFILTNKNSSQISDKLTHHTTTLGVKITKLGIPYSSLTTKISSKILNESNSNIQALNKNNDKSSPLNIKCPVLKHEFVKKSVSPSNEKSAEVANGVTNNKNWRRQKQKNKSICTSSKTVKKRKPNYLCKVKYEYGYLFDVTFLENGTNLKYSPEESSAIAINALKKRFSGITTSTKISKNYVCPHMKYSNKNVCFISDRQTALKEHLLTHGDCYYKCPKCNLIITDKKTGLNHCKNVCKIIQHDNELSQYFVVNTNSDILKTYKENDPHKHKALSAKELQLALLSVKKKKGFPLPVNKDGSIDTSIIDKIIDAGENNIQHLEMSKQRKAYDDEKQSSNYSINKNDNHLSGNNNCKDLQSNFFNLNNEFSILKTNLKCSFEAAQVQNSRFLYTEKPNLDQDKVMHLLQKTNSDRHEKANWNVKTNLDYHKSSYLENQSSLMYDNVEYFKKNTLQTITDYKLKQVNSKLNISNRGVNQITGIELLLKATECLDYDYNIKKTRFVQYSLIAAQEFKSRNSKDCYFK